MASQSYMGKKIFNVLKAASWDPGQCSFPSQSNLPL